MAQVAVLGVADQDRTGGLGDLDTVGLPNRVGRLAPSLGFDHFSSPLSFCRGGRQRNLHIGEFVRADEDVAQPQHLGSGPGTAAARDEPGLGGQLE